MRTVYPVGTTLYQPDRCCNGYTLLWRGHAVRLIDMNGRAAHAWQVSTDEIDDRVDRARLLANGNVLVQRGGMMTTTGAIEEYDWEGRLAWQYFPQGGFPHRDLLGPHHDVFRKPDGNTLLICRQAVARHHLSRITDPRYRVDPFYEDVILEVDRDGEVVWRWHGAEHLNLNQYRVLASPGWHAGPHNSTACDWMHTNTVQALPENRWADAGDPRFRPGNVLISPRSLDAVHIIDRQTKQVVWTYSGDYMGGLSGQHEPHMIEKGLPGAGNILIFDNGASPWKDLGHAGRSYVLEVNPFTQETVWRYEDGERFHSCYTSSAQRLANGNTLICESAGRRVFEVTVEGETVWEHVGDTPRAYRYAYEHCPQTAALGRPRKMRVTPPAELRIPPDKPLED